MARQLQPNRIGISGPLTMKIGGPSPYFGNNPEEVILSIDPSLAYISDLIEFDSAPDYYAQRPVFQVMGESSVPLVLKVGYSQNIFVQKECDYTRRAQGIAGIPTLLKIYTFASGIAFLKEYIEGRDLQIGEKFSDPMYETQAYGILEQLHQRNLVGFDFNPTNFVETPSQLYLVDLGMGIPFSPSDEARLENINPLTGNKYIEDWKIFDFKQLKSFITRK